MKLIKTSIAGLDEFLTGGLPPKILLLSGLPGSGNEVFARQIAYNRAKDCGITYFTINSAHESIKEDMAAYNWDITPLQENGNWKFKTITKGNMTDTIIEEIDQGRSIIIDSISEVLLNHKIDECINLITAMSQQNKNKELYQLLLITQGMQDQKYETIIQHFAEGIISFETAWAGDTAKRNMLIKKMIGTFVPSRSLPYTIGRRGFIIETATRI